jgi:hypothetical protein
MTKGKEQDTNELLLEALTLGEKALDTAQKRAGEYQKQCKILRAKLGEQGKTTGGISGNTELVERLKMFITKSNNVINDVSSD